MRALSNFQGKKLLGQSVSGFGLDFMISEYLRKNGRSCGVIDAVGIGDYSTIDEQNGSYYRLMRSLEINQKLELYAVILEQNKLPTFQTIKMSEPGRKK